MPDGPVQDRKTSSVPIDVTAVAGNDEAAAAPVMKPDIPHITDRFIPISHVIAVLTRSAYSELRRLRLSLVDASDQKRKKRIVDFAAKYRAEIIKVLVLVGWASRAEEVSTAIDLRAWLQGQKNCFDNLYSLVRYDVLRNLEAAKITGPDIPTAIDVLTTGTLPRLKNTPLAKHFRIPVPLDAREITKTLRTLDALISLRLLLHERIPSIMRDYTIGSGRVTFHVPNEFSMDLFFATEEVDDPNLQWFMIDFRFAFTKEDYIDTPMSLKLEIENVANSLLGRVVSESRGSQQLVELYNFLHSFTIQYKLERLFSQFSSIGGREKGRIDLKYASAQKILVVGYWLQKRHREKKTVLNSMTITIDSPPTSLKDTLMSSTSTTADFNREQLKLVVRLGEEEQTWAPINIEEHGASSLLAAVVQNRISSVLDQIYRCLLHRDLTFTNGSSDMQQSGLVIRLLRQEYIHLSIDAYNGSYLVTLRVEEDSVYGAYPNQATEQLQATLNTTELPRDIAHRLHEFKFKYMKKSIELSATSAFWSIAKMIPTSVHLDEFGRAFSSDDSLVSPTSCLFLTRDQEGWKDTEGGSSWFVVINLRAHALHLWLAEFVVNEKQAKFSIQWVEPLNLGPVRDHVAVDAQLDPSLFDRLWRLCAARVISLQLSRGLAERSIDHRYVKEMGAPSWSSIDIPTIVFAAEDVSSTRYPWSEPLVRVELLQLCTEPEGGAIVSFMCRRISGLDFDMQQCGDMEIHADATSLQFSFNFRAIVAQSCNVLIEQFCRKWRMVENTVGLLETLKGFQDSFVLQSVSLNLASFAYADNAYLVRIQQQPSLLDGAIQLSVTLGSVSNKRNPHQRIEQYLSPIATKYQSDMKVFFHLLTLTLPVLDALHIIEQESLTNPAFYVVARSAESFRIYYPRLHVTLLIRARPAPSADVLPDKFKKIANSIVWHFTDGSRSSLPVLGQQRMDSCDRIFTEGLNDVLDTDLTFPEGSGIGSAPTLARRVLLEVHRTICSTQMPPDAARARSTIKNKGEKTQNRKSENTTSNKGQTGQARRGDKTTASRGQFFPDHANHAAQGTSEVIEII
ncbi:protein of unknown function [Taphrina deformans PYCC 5710]|uniref:Mediator of RNA polymerase II transcription subunit 14 n=1 Tax=Taphrina deformans (strain PYCC 5710 / ATCC 11124 / CBS 356.35 / IMI 108563 / JCM 9778 / NBRC 8474) TaxID=1097556 RepID=R4XGA0_TAPDE|nr:protein of unknown function [Taphrina deformans PYCC 5710]|eukprot:CCG84652.1 protein of unknown function [Taphrina deformans PYCC 5710]